VRVSPALTLTSWICACIQDTVVDSGGLNETYILDGVQIPTCEWANLRGNWLAQDMPRNVLLGKIIYSAGTEPVLCGCRLECFTNARWRHLANTTEPSVCGGDAALSEITLTACFCYIRAFLWLRRLRVQRERCTRP